MDIMQEFEHYLPRWSNEKHLPIPTKKHPDRWYEAWSDFLNEVLTPRYEELQTDYLNMQYKTNDIMDSTDIMSVYEEPVKEEVEIKKSNWQLVQEKRRKLME